MLTVTLITTLLIYHDSYTNLYLGVLNTNVHAYVNNYYISAYCNTLL